MDVDLPEVHARALDAHARFVAGVGDDQWGDPSACDDWTVRELVNHIVTGNYWADELAGGKTIEEVGDALDGDVLGDDPVRAYDDSAARGRGGVPRAGRDGRAVRGVVRAGAGVGVLRAPVHRRADPRVGRREVDRPGHHPRPRARRRVLGGRSSRSSRCCWASGAFGTRCRCPTTPTPRRSSSRCSAATPDRRGRLRTGSASPTEARRER